MFTLYYHLSKVPFIKKYYLLLLGLLFYFFSIGKYATSFGVWLAPIFLLAHLNTLPKKKSLLIISFIIILLFPIQWYSYIPAPMPLYLIICLGNALFFLIPYLLHIGLYNKAKHYTLLVFPLSIVLVEFLLASFSPYASWGAMVYAKPYALVYNQLTSITGIYGVSFMIGLTASLLAWIKHQNFQQAVVVPPLLILLTAHGAVWIYGTVRLKAKTTAKQVTYVVGITVPLSSESIIFSDIDYTQVGAPLKDTLNVFKDVYLLNKSVPTQQQEEVDKWFENMHQKLLAQTVIAADRGAEIIVWSEGNGLALKHQEAMFIEQCQKLAVEKDIVLLATLNTKTLGQTRSENKVVAIDPKGQVVFTHLKSYPVPGAENSVKGDGLLKTITTTYGKISTVICFDADFPRLVRQAKHLESDLLFVPSFDWEAIDPYHTYMARIRAIENGIPLFRQANNGLSAAYDEKGRVVATHRYVNEAQGYIFLVPLAIHSTFTLYSQLGDFFPYLCILSLLFIVIIRYRKKG
ncbi:MAG: nitrilase-related carbon-nitrogen hydrolase [Thermonemataceae bacterium]